MGEGKRAAKRARDNRARLARLSSSQRLRIENRIRHVTPSAPWYRACVDAMDAGEAFHRHAIEKELRRVGLFPPGGDKTLMLPCFDCGSENPPQTISAPLLLDEDLVTRRLRAKRITLQNAARLIGIEPRLLSDWIHGRIRPKRAHALARALARVLGVDVHALFAVRLICDPCAAARGLRGRRETAGRSHRTTTHSPSGAAGVALERRTTPEQRPIVEYKVELASEDEAHLKAEVEAYMKGAASVKQMVI